MARYRIYIIGRDDHFGADDQEATQKAEQTIDGRDIELWERDSRGRLSKIRLIGSIHRAINLLVALAVVALGGRLVNF